MRLRILSYNIHRAIGVDRRFRPDRIIKILDYYQADVVLLQEVDVGVPRSREMDMAKMLADSLDYPYYTIGLNVQLRKGQYGNATLSRYPIKDQRNIDLTIDNRKSRGCLHTSLSIHGKEGNSHMLEVFNLHLGLSYKERPRQIGLLVRSAEFASLTNNQPCLVGGDFNDWWIRIAPMFTEIMGFDCATNHKRGYQNAFLTYPSFSPTSGLDKIFYRGSIRRIKGKSCRIPTARVASDHLPVIADFELY